MDTDNNAADINIKAVKVTDTQTRITVRLGEETVAVDSFNITRQKSRADFLNKLKEDRPGININEIEKLLLDVAATQADASDKPPPPGPSREDLLEAMKPIARQQARVMLEDPNLIQRIVNDIGAIGVAGEKELACMIYMIGTSRLLAKPLAGIVQGPSSSGKSHTIEKTSLLFPPEAVLSATQMTPQALYYMPPGSLRNRFIVAGERSRVADDDTAEATRALREMLSGGRLSKLIPIKAEGKMVTQHIQQDGPIAFVESTTLSNIFDEDLNRAVLLTTDEQESQTRNIITSIANKFASNGAGRGQHIIENHWALQRTLEPATVLIPFAPKLGDHFPGDRVEARRAFPHLLSLIQASALLHQFQRQRDADGHILADRDDYILARGLMIHPLLRQLGGGLSEPAKRFFGRMKAAFDIAQFTTKEARGAVKAGRATVHGWLTELADAGGVELIQEGKGPKPFIWKLADELSQPADAILPPVNILFPDS